MNKNNSPNICIHTHNKSIDYYHKVFLLALRLLFRYGLIPNVVDVGPVWITFRMTFLKPNLGFTKFANLDKDSYFC